MKGFARLPHRLVNSREGMLSIFAQPVDGEIEARNLLKLQTNGATPLGSLSEGLSEAMMDEPTRDGRRLSKFSNADRGAYRPPNAELNEDGAAEKSGATEPPLVSLIEHVIRDGVRDATADKERAKSSFEQPQKLLSVPGKLIEELEAAQNQMRDSYKKLGDQSAPEAQVIIGGAGGRLQLVTAGFGTAIPRGLKGSGNTLLTAIRGALRRLLQLSRRMRPKDWRRRYLAFLSVLHRYVFDRGTERLLFSKTPSPNVYTVWETEAGLQKAFVYEGPIPRKTLDWALSAIPSDLKRYAFVDFLAGNGRTLLLPPNAISNSSRATPSTARVARRWR